MQNKTKRQQLVLFGILLLIVFSHPFIGLADKPIMVFGIPLLYLYILLAWIIAILLMYQLSSGKTKKKDE